MGSKTLRAKVDNLSFLIERVASDCAPQQEVRELTQNAIEAILETPEKKGKVQWDAEWLNVAVNGAYKLSISDNGCGMTGDDIKRYINRVSSSRKEQSLETNFGIGGKVTAGYHNPHGVQYLSWKDGIGTMARYWLDPEIDEYGLMQYPGEDGTYTHTPNVDPAYAKEIKPSFIKQNGTVVVLLGKSDDQHTMEAPKGIAYPTHWLTRYLNRRYFRFPEGIEVRVREFAKRDPENWPLTPPSRWPDGGQFRRIYGHAHYLDRHNTASGKVELTGATAWWWILKENIRQIDFWQCNGHAAALHKNEVYELREGQTGRRMLMRFGVLFGTQRVVIYVEPKNGKNRVTSNTARSQLQVNGEPLPWDEWADEFREKMPDAIQDLMETILSGSTTKDHRDAIKERLKSIKRLFKMTRYRRTVKGEVLTDGTVSGGLSNRVGTARSRGKSGGSGGGGASGDTYGALLASTGDPANPVSPLLLQPKVDWITIKDGTREPDHLEDRAACYIEKENQIQANYDFRAFTDMRDYWLKEYSDAAVSPEIIAEVVREWFEQQLVEAVMGARALEGSQQWSDDDLDKCLSEEALTLAVMPRYHVYVAVKRSLGAKIGSLKARG